MTQTLHVTMMGAALALASLAGCASKVREAQEAENRGDHATALALYAAETGSRAPATKHPDKKDARLLTPDAYRKVIGEYLAWVAPVTPVAPLAEVEGLLQGVERCSSGVEPVNYLIEMKVRKAEPDSMSRQWADAFFPNQAAMPAGYGPMIQEALSRTVSMLTIISSPSFSYEGFLLDRAGGRKTDFFLFAQNRVSFLVRPGNYLLFCKSKKKFSATQVWESPMTVVPVTIPQEPSLISCKIMTRVVRGK